MMQMMMIRSRSPMVTQTAMMMVLVFLMASTASMGSMVPELLSPEAVVVDMVLVGMTVLLVLAGVPKKLFIYFLLVFERF